MAASTDKKRFKRKAGDASKKKKKRRPVSRKPKANSLSHFTTGPWFQSLKAFLMADTFAYGPLINQEVDSYHSTLANIGKVLKKAFVRSPGGVLKGPSRVVKDALVTAPTREREPKERLGLSGPEENRSETGGGQVVQIEYDASAGRENISQKRSEAETVGVVESSIISIKKKVVTTTTFAANELGGLKSTMAEPHSPVDPTIDTEVTDPEDLEGDEEQSHAGDGNAPLDFETAETVAGRLIEKLGGRFSKDLDIHVDDGDEEVERWFLAANLFSRSLPFSVSKQTYKALMALGVSKVTDFIKVEEAKLTELFERTGYTKYGQRVTTQFRKLAYQMQDGMWGQVSTLKHTAYAAELTRQLRALNGVKLSAVHSFMRELRGVWRACDSDFDNQTKKAAVHLKLLRSMKRASEPEDALMAFALEAGIDARDLEVACFKLGAEHEKDYVNCKGGPECEAINSRDRFLSSLI